MEEYKYKDMFTFHALMTCVEAPLFSIGRCWLECYP